MNAAIANLEKTIDTETAAARAALKVALQHAANVGRAYGAVRDLLTQSEVQAWLTSTTCADRHTIMSMRRISMCDLDTKARTLADLMFDRAAEHIAQGARGRSRSENIEINRRRMMAGSCGRPRNAPAAFIHPCQPIVAKQPPPGPGWAHELKHDGYRLQIHVRDGRVKLYTINGADWSKRYPLITEAATRIGGSAILDAEVVWLGLDGVPDFDALHSRVNDRSAVPLAFDLMSLDGEDFRHEPFSERKAVLRKVLRRSRRGIQYVEHTEGDGVEMFQAICNLGLEGIVSKKLDAPYKSGPSKAWLKIKNPKAPAATRADGTF